MEKLRLLVVTGLALAGAALAGPSAFADDFKFGIRGGYYTKLDDAFLGGELLIPLDHRFFFNPNVEYVFVNDGTYITFNADFHYDFRSHSPAYVWLGAGLALVHDDPAGPDNTQDDVAANFLGGVGFRTGSSLIPYFQAKVIAKHDSIFSIAFGLRF